MGLLFFSQKLASKMGGKVSLLCAFLFRKFRVGWVASRDFWIDRARPLAGIVIYRSECVRVKHSILVCCQTFGVFASNGVFFKFLVDNGQIFIAIKTVTDYFLLFFFCFTGHALRTDNQWRGVLSMKMRIAMCDGRSCILLRMN